MVRSTTELFNMPDPPRVANATTFAHIAPLTVFMGFLMLLEVLRVFGFSSPDGSAVWWHRQPELWLYPLQTIVTLLVLAAYWNHYEFRPFREIRVAVAAGLVGIAVWIAPGFLFERLHMTPGPLQFLGFTSRTGDEPSFLAAQGQSGLYELTIVMRFVRLVIAVPLAEEIFWRGFLMRYLTQLEGDYWKVPFGTFHWRSLVGVTTAFVMVHTQVDYFGAAVFGLLMYWVTVRTKSLAACVVMHAVANLLLGIYVLVTQQWGYW